MTKTCTRCRQELPRSNFYTYRDGQLFGRCKHCHAATTRERLARLANVTGAARIRTLTLTDAGRQTVQEAQDAEARRKAMAFSVRPVQVASAETGGRGMTYMMAVARHVEAMSSPELADAIRRLRPLVEAGTDKGRLLYFVLLSWRLIQLEDAA